MFGGIVIKIIAFSYLLNCSRSVMQIIEKFPYKIIVIIHKYRNATSDVISNAYIYVRNTYTRIYLRAFHLFNSYLCIYITGSFVGWLHFFFRFLFFRFVFRLFAVALSMQMLKQLSSWNIELLHIMIKTIKYIFQQEPICGFVYNFILLLNFISCMVVRFVDRYNITMCCM